jgi:hypothetical protein
VSVWKLSGPVRFDPVGGEVLVEDVAQFFQTRKEFPGIFALPVGQVGKTVNDEFVISGCGEFSLE